MALFACKTMNRKSLSLNLAPEAGLDPDSDLDCDTDSDTDPGVVPDADTDCDPDWAGDLADRRSTSAGRVFHGERLLRSSVRTQGTTALSSGEAEFTTGAKASAVILGVRSLGADLGMELNISIRAHSIASK